MDRKTHTFPTIIRVGPVIATSSIYCPVQVYRPKKKSTSVRDLTSVSGSTSSASIYTGMYYHHHATRRRSYAALCSTCRSGRPPDPRKWDCFGWSRSETSPTSAELGLLRGGDAVSIIRCWFCIRGQFAIFGMCFLPFEIFPKGF